MTEFGYSPYSIAPEAIKNWPEYDVDALLKPVDISTDLSPLDEKTGTFRYEVYPPYPDTYWFVMGFRVFNGPREVLIEEVVLDCYSLYQGRFDAAAFNLETPPLPLMNSGKPYAGEPFRFVKQELGRIARYAPLRFMLRPWSKDHDLTRLDAIMIVREDRCYQYPVPGSGMPPMPPGLGGR